jgi:hypothetical protein
MESERQNRRAIMPSLDPTTLDQLLNVGDGNLLPNVEEKGVDLD